MLLVNKIKLKHKLILMYKVLDENAPEYLQE